MSGCGDDNVHTVGNLSKSLISPSCTTVGAVPVCYVTVSGTGRCLSRNSYDSVSCIGIGELATCHTVSIAGEHVSVSNFRNDNVLLVGKLSKSLISPSCTTVGAVPVCYVTGSGTGCCLSLNSYNGVSRVLIAELAAYLAVSIAGEHVGVTECGDLLLCNYSRVTNRAALTFGKACFGTGCCLACNNLLGVAKCLTLNRTAIGTSLGCRAGCFCPVVLNGFCTSCERCNSDDKKHSQD